MDTPSAMTTALTDFMSVVSTMLTTIKGDPFLVLYLVAPIAGIGIACVRKFVGKY